MKKALKFLLHLLILLGQAGEMAGDPVFTSTIQTCCHAADQTQPFLEQTVVNLGKMSLKTTQKKPKEATKDPFEREGIERYFGEYVYYLSM